MSVINMTGYNFSRLQEKINDRFKVEICLTLCYTKYVLNLLELTKAAIKGKGYSYS